MSRKKYTAESIVSITSDRDKVRIRPTMFVPTTDVYGSLHIIYEIIDNAIDEVYADRSDTGKGSQVTIVFDTKTKEIVVSDNGRGIPLEKVLEVCTVLNSTGKINNTKDTAYQYSGGVNGVGLKLAVFLSEYCMVTSKRNKTSLTYRFTDGLLDEESREPSKQRGTTVQFKLSNKYLDIKSLTVDMIRDRLKEKAYLYPDINLRLIVVDNGKEKSNVVFIKKDIVDRVQKFKPDTDIIRITEDRDVRILDTDDKMRTKNVVIDLAFALSENAIDMDKTESIIAYGNSIKNYTGGAHVDGLRDGVVKYFRNNVLEKINSKKNEDAQVLPSDIIAGLCGFVTVKVHNPIFRGQHKDQLSNQEVKFAVRDAVCDALEREKPTVMKKYVDFVKLVAKGRIASKKTRKKDVSNAYSKDKIKKYSPIIESIYTTDPELLIVEGDSAAGGAMAGADKYNQAIYSTSRPTNLIDAELSVVSKAKSAFNDIIDICGIELGRNCDVSKSKMKRILILTDADCDGEVIAISILGLIAKHCPDLIKNKMVGRIVPPAYSYEEGRKTIYVTSQTHFFERLMKKFSKQHTLFKRDKKLSESEMLSFLMNNFDYKDKLDNLCERFSMDPLLMEHIALYYKRNESVSYWKKILREYKSIEVAKDGKNIIIEGVVNNDTIHLILDQYFDDKSYKFRMQLRRNLIIYGFSIDDDTKLSIYQVMKKFSKYMPKDITRYKGLGEMDPPELKELCLGKNRTVKMFVFKDIKEDLDKIHIMLSSKQTYAQVRSDILMNRVADDLEIDT